MSKVKWAMEAGHTLAGESGHAVTPCHILVAMLDEPGGLAGRMLLEEQAAGRGNVTELRVGLEKLFSVPEIVGVDVSLAKKKKKKRKSRRKRREIDIEESHNFDLPYGIVSSQPTKRPSMKQVQDCWKAMIRMAGEPESEPKVDSASSSQDPQVAEEQTASSITNWGSIVQQEPETVADVVARLGGPFQAIEDLLQVLFNDIDVRKELEAAEFDSQVLAKKLKPPPITFSYFIDELIGGWFR
eukprot:gnl/MRDRNA2_/MRDRNA2_66445_c0_seq1.p1 gnl/MRDRNA2_/MRDRNA2_66445_c0~~gnl/MRDRNA2_/MRDRNA2_66445_c0_seq1.p1  ORF type:complete len:242 (-),score=60.16 gnl/MRDRNA2_/MRDRNA2_66445_c0_seq1:108-833(-)